MNSKIELQDTEISAIKEGVLNSLQTQLKGSKEVNKKIKNIEDILEDHDEEKLISLITDMKAEMKQMHEQQSQEREEERQKFEETLQTQNLNFQKELREKQDANEERIWAQVKELMREGRNLQRQVEGQVEESTEEINRLQKSIKGQFEDSEEERKEFEEKQLRSISALKELVLANEESLEEGLKKSNTLNKQAHLSNQDDLRQVEKEVQVLIKNISTKFSTQFVELEGKLSEGVSANKMTDEKRETQILSIQEKLDREIKKIKEDEEKADDRMKELDTQIKTLQSQIDSRFGDMHSMVTQNEDETEKIRKSLLKMESEPAVIQPEEVIVGPTEEDFVNLSDRVDTISQELSELRAIAQTPIKPDLSLEMRITEIEEKFTEQLMNHSNGTQQMVRDANEHLKDKISIEMRNQIQRLTTIVNSLQSESQKVKVNELEEKFERLDSQLTEKQREVEQELNLLKTQKISVEDLVKPDPETPIEDFAEGGKLRCLPGSYTLNRESLATLDEFENLELSPSVKSGDSSEFK